MLYDGRYAVILRGWEYRPAGKRNRPKERIRFIAELDYADGTTEPFEFLSYGQDAVYFRIIEAGYQWQYCEPGFDNKRRDFEYDAPILVTVKKNLDHEWQLDTVKAADMDAIEWLQTLDANEDLIELFMEYAALSED